MRLPGGHPLLNFYSGGRGPGGLRRFSLAEIQQIGRTVRGTPEVMVKITGGGTKVRGVSAHMDYITRHDRLELETDEGERITNRDQQKALLGSWHFELSAGQYRGSHRGQAPARRVKLTHHIVLSMPAPTPPDKVLAAARKFAREKFALQHRYVMVLHTDQRHPHVHLVVKAESEHGKRLHIDKPMLREWREEFARLMREQGVAANATPRVIRGRNKGRTNNAIFRAQRHGASHAVRRQVIAIAKEIHQTGTVRDPVNRRLSETRRAIIASWMKAADALDAQGEVALAREVRQFVRGFPPVLTDKERLAVKFIHRLETHRAVAVPRTRDRGEDLTR